LSTLHKIEHTNYQSIIEELQMIQNHSHTNSPTWTSMSLLVTLWEQYEWFWLLSMPIPLGFFKFVLLVFLFSLFFSSWLQRCVEINLPWFYFLRMAADLMNIGWRNQWLLLCACWYVGTIVHLQDRSHVKFAFRKHKLVAES